MRGLFKNRLVLGAGLFGIVDLAQAFVVASPILIYLRILMENTESARRLWPLPSPGILADILLNLPEVVGFYFIAAIILYLVFYVIRSFFAGGIYGVIIFRESENGFIRSRKEFLKSCVEVWTGFLKAGVLGFFVYIAALFIGMMIGEFLGRFGIILKYIVVAGFLLMGSTYIQIIKIQLVSSGDTSIRNAIINTRDKLAGSLARIIVGNISVSAAIFIGVLIFWYILKVIKSGDWNIIYMILAIIIQQVMIFVICLGQTLRINFNYSIIRKGVENAVGGNELG